MKQVPTRDESFALLQKYNEDSFLIRHGISVEAVMEYFASELGYTDEIDYWSRIGLLHDVDFGMFPEEHCSKAPELLKEINASDDFIKSIVSHGYGIFNEIKPEHEMEKILYATDELTGLIYAAALMRPSKSSKDMELKSLKKKFKDKRFAAGCSRDVIKNGAEMLGWELDELLEKTLEAMKAKEDKIEELVSSL